MGFWGSISNKILFPCIACYNIKKEGSNSLMLNCEIVLLILIPWNMYDEFYFDFSINIVSIATGKCIFQALLLEVNEFFWKINKDENYVRSEIAVRGNMKQKVFLKNTFAIHKYLSPSNANDSVLELISAVISRWTVSKICLLANLLANNMCPRTG